MSAVRSRHRRWTFGGLLTLRMNRGSLAEPTLTARQRRDFRSGEIFWVDGLFITALTAAFTSIGVALLGLAAATAFRWGVFARGAISLPEWFLLASLVYCSLVLLSAMLFDYLSQTARRRPELTSIASERIGGSVDPAASPAPQH